VAKVIDHVAPLPMAAIHSTQDEYVPLDEIRRVMAAAREPKQLWIVKASNHRFSDNLAEFDRRLLEAMSWIAKAGQ
jgi:dipeptidyl aminopeptidase/acylaminoacyl peptidase